jgi:hypothetical protein
MRAFLLFLLLILIAFYALVPAGAAGGSVSVSFTVSGTVVDPASQGGGGGGGRQTGSSSNDYRPSAGPAQPPIIPSVPVFYGSGPVDTSSSGTTREPVIITSLDHGASLLIPAGVLALDVSGMPLRQVGITPFPGEGFRSPATDLSMVSGRTYEISPPGATISPPATLTLYVPSSLWSSDTRVSIQVLDPSTGTWAVVPSSVQPGSMSLSTPVSRLGVFGLFGEPPAVPPHLEPIQPIPAEKFAAPGEQARGGIIASLGGLAGSAISSVTGNPAPAFILFLIALAGALAFTLRDQVARYRTWITLYLISMTGLLWAVFTYDSGGPLSDSVFIATIVVGLNLIVHVFRYDRVVVPLPGGARNAPRVP